MARVRGVFALLILIALQAHASHNVPSFREGKHYVYNYAARVATGVADGPVRQFSGFGTKATLAIERKGSQLFFKFSDAYFAPFNGQLNEDLFKEIPLDYVKVADVVGGNQNDADINYSFDPFGATFEEGVVTKFHYDKDVHEVESRHNFKRAIISMFQTNFKSPGDDGSADHYHVFEGGIGGTCDTMYQFTYLPLDPDSEVEVMNVTKHRHYDNCLHRPHIFHSDMQGSQCAKCKQDSNPLETVSKVKYQLTGNRNKFTIDRIDSTGLISFTPFTTHGQTVLSLVNQTLILERIEDTLEIVSDDLYIKRLEPSFTTDHQLAYRFNADLYSSIQDPDMKKAHYYSDVIEVFHHPRTEPRENLPEKVKELIGAPTDNHIGRGEGLVNILEFLQTMSFEEFEIVYDALVWSDNDDPLDHYRTALVSLIGVTGTNPAIEYIIHAIETKKVKNKMEAFRMVEPIALFVRQPTEKIVRRLMAFAKSEEAQHFRPMYSNTLLNVGSIIYKGCEKDPFNPHTPRASPAYEPYIPVEVCAKFADELVDTFFLNATETSEKLLSIRVLKNVGTTEAFNYLLNVVGSVAVDGFIRQPAIWALTEFSESYYHTAIKVLSPIFYNSTEDYVTRIYAFDALLALDQDFEFYGDLIPFLAKEETNMQLKSHVYSVLVSIANATHPCFTKASENARYVLRYIAPVHSYAFRHSKSKIFSMFNDKYNFGRTSALSWIANDNTIIPREIWTSQSFSVLGYDFNFLQVGFRQEGLDELRLPSYSPLHDQHENFKTKYAAPLTAHDDKRTQGSSKAPQFEFYATVFGYDIQSLTYDDFILVSQDSWFNNKPGNNKIPLQFNCPIAFSNVRYTIPNDMGFPVKLELFMPAVAQIDGHLELIPIKGVKYHIGFDAHTHLIVHVKGSMGVVSPNGQQYGYAIKTEAGWQRNIKAEIGVRGFVKLDIEYTPSNEPYSVAHYKTTPYTYGRMDPERHVHYSDHPTEKHYKFGHNYLGVGVDFQFKYDYDWNDFGSYRSFLKSFFKKSTNYDDYYYLIDRWYAGTRGFMDYAILNPTFRPFQFEVVFAQSPTYPTTKFTAKIEYDTNDMILINEDGERGYDERKLDIEIVGEGKIDRHWKLSLESRKLRDHSERDGSIFFERSAHPDWDENDFTACWRTEGKYFGYPGILRGFTKEEVKAEYSAKLQISKNCRTEADSERQVTITARAEKSDEQKEVSKYVSPATRKCLLRSVNKFRYSNECWQAKKELGRLDKFTIDIDHKNTPVSVRNYFRRFFSFLRHYFYDNLEIEYFGVANPADHINIVANFSFDEPIVDVQIKRPDENVFYHNVYVPSISPRFEPFTLAENFGQRYMRKLLDYQSPMCFVSDDKVRTFDAVTYDNPHTECYQLAFAHCNTWELSVFIRNLPKKSHFEKSLKIYVGSSELEISSLSRDSEDRKPLEASVDGTVIAKDGTKYTSDYLVVYQFLDGYKIQLPKQQTSVYFDGKDLIIKSNTNVYLGLLCGLCGKFDGELDHEFTDHFGCEMEDPTTYAYSYTFPEGDCKVPDFKYPC